MSFSIIDRDRIFFLLLHRPQKNSLVIAYSSNFIFNKDDDANQTTHDHHHQQ